MLTNSNQIDPAATAVGEIVALDINSAKIFERYGIDFCCKGNRTLKSACEEKNIETDEILSELLKLTNRENIILERYENWELGFLIDYIINNHHTYVRNSTPQVILHLEKVVKKHGKKFKQLNEIQSLFNDVAAELFAHMQKEERILFHIIKYLEETDKFNEKPKTQGFKSIKFPIQAMESEHTNAGNSIERIRLLTNNFTPPEEACNTFKQTYNELEEFEKDLHIHIHLENNILFPKAIELENKLLNHN